MQRRRSYTAVKHPSKPPRAPSLKQRRFLDLLSRKLGHSDGRAFLESWAGKDRRGLLIWTARTVYLAIEEALARLKAQQPASDLSSPPGSPDQTQRRQAA